MMRLSLALLVCLVAAVPTSAQTVPPGPTFVQVDRAGLDPQQPAVVQIYGWALKCQGTILGIHAFARPAGGRAWKGWGRDFATLYPRPDVAYAFMADAARQAGVSCEHPTEYAGFEVRLDATAPDLLTGTGWPAGVYDVVVCVEDSGGGRGVLAACSPILPMTKP